MDSKMRSILTITLAVLGTFVPSSVGSIDGWRLRDLGWVEGKNVQSDEQMK